jgi:hypothetical protein
MRSLALLALATCLACNDHLDVFQLDSGIDDGNGQDSGPPDSGIHVAVVPADILFVVDNSGSMADEQENLALNFARFVDQTIGAADYQIGVVTTDLSSQNGERGGYQNFVFDSAYPNILTNFSGSDCQDLGIAHGCFRGPDPQKRIITSSLSREEQIATFGGNVRVGSCGSGTEKGLGAILAALGYTGRRLPPTLRQPGHRHRFGRRGSRPNPHREHRECARRLQAVREDPRRHHRRLDRRRAFPVPDRRRRRVRLALRQPAADGQPCCVHPQPRLPHRGRDLRR